MPTIELTIRDSWQSAPPSLDLGRAYLGEVPPDQWRTEAGKLCLPELMGPHSPNHPLNYGAIIERHHAVQVLPQH